MLRAVGTTASAVSSTGGGGVHPAHTANGFQPSLTLKSRSYIGLVLSQFLAAFNDQASHIVAFFYATDMLVRFVGVQHVDTKLIVMIVTACYIMPYFLFSPLAGVMADKYSKRSIIVSWKLAEVGIMALALVGFLLPHLAGWISQSSMAVCSSVLLVLVVFLMGTHSAFFVPAKYGMMPEILDTSILSRGNGLLEGSSFIANILGTVFGGLLYFEVKSGIDSSGATTVLIPGHEWIIGLLLFALAIVGAVGSLLVEKIPPVAPDQPLVWEPWTPMKQNLRVLRRSRPLVLATVGIAFFLFMTLFLRQSLLFQGETAEEIQLALKLQQKLAAVDDLTANGTLASPAVAIRPKLNSDTLTTPDSKDAADDDETEAAPNAAPTDPPATAVKPALPKTTTANLPVESKTTGKAQRTEFNVALLIGLVGLGVGIGCSLAGYFSGNRIELGLVPIGAVLLVVAAAVMAVIVSADKLIQAKIIICLIAVGAAAGLYIVPLYTLLQHRAPKESKGSLVATSNFLNVTGGLVAVVLFYLLTSGLQSVLGLTLTPAAVRHSPQLLPHYLHQLERTTQIPKLLFLSASLVTLGMLALMWWQRPDFVLRAFSWIRSSRRRHLRALGLDNIPANGQVILVSNSRDFDHWIHVVSAVDRFTRFVAPPDVGGEKWLRNLALSTGVMIAANRKVRLSAEDNALARGLVTLGQGYMLGLSLADDFAADAGELYGSEPLLAELRSKVRVTILPVYCGEKPTHPDAVRHPESHTYVVIGDALPPETSFADIRAAVMALGA
ncbi:MAG TPA: MFS transporter [Pirellulales bacterium]